MTWQVVFHPDFFKEFEEFSENLQNLLLTKLHLLEEYGPQLGRPHVDTLYGSAFPKMKELRIDTLNEVWRIAFAFDQERNAILLVAGDKKGFNKKGFYTQLIKKADKRLNEHISKFKKDG